LEEKISESLAGFSRPITAPPVSGSQKMTAGLLSVADLRIVMTNEYMLISIWATMCAVPFTTGHVSGGGLVTK